MCLITRQKKAKILKKDLIVYKCLNQREDGTFNSYFQSDFVWLKNYLYQISYLNPILRTNNFENHGIWYYADSMANNKYRGISQTYYITYGFHACLTRKRCNQLKYNSIIKEFLIPKGSKVFYDATGLIVSNQMMLL